jgi:hypothetical protein
MAASAGAIVRIQRGPSGSQTRARTIPPILQRSRSLSRRREAVGPRRGEWAAGSNFWSAWPRAGRLASMPKYPLEPLAELRRKKVEAATAALAEAVRKREAAARALRGAEVRREAAVRAAAAVRTAELEELGRGHLHVRDLARAHAWAARAAAEQEALAGVVRRAGAVEARARDHEQESQGALATRSADVRVVAGHRERWDAERRRALEAREEEALSEAWRRR